MKRLIPSSLLFVLCLWLPIYSLANNSLASSDQSLKVSAGQHYVLPPASQLLVLEQLVLEDDAVLDISQAGLSVLIRAESVMVGEGVRIVGRGKNGAEGSDAASYKDAESDCNDPDSGRDGLAGEDGGDGIDLNLDWGISSFGSLTIDLSGGDAGRGGDGGDGQSADEDVVCGDVLRGGDAGDGGDAGAAGDGGNLTFTYRASDQNLAFAAKTHTLVKNSPGETAAGGKPGSPGSGTPGKYINKKTLSGSRKWEAGGKLGRKGKAGANSKEGNDGQTVFQLGAVTSGAFSTVEPKAESKIATKLPVGPKSSTANSTDTSLEQRILLLEEQVKRLSERLTALER